MAIDLIDVESRSQRELSFDPWTIVPKWSPDGDWIFYSREGGLPWWSPNNVAEPHQVIVRQVSTGRESVVGMFFKSDPADFHWITNHELCR
jgi:Tol biopolymer transport system component